MKIVNTTTGLSSDYLRFLVPVGGPTLANRAQQAQSRSVQPRSTTLTLQRHARRNGQPKTA